ncbi:MAG TPA: DUF4070 domain-containing protein [Deltaproteobacteria bacterium]|nr:DUF4070 domain-containing protein [Deltaproteobacteria bacterium]
MNALFVYPRIPRTYWSFTHALEFLSKKAAFPPLGLLTVAAMAPKGWRRRLVDLNVRELTDEDLSWADSVFVSAMSVQKASLLEVVRRARRHGVRVVAGGPLFTRDMTEYPEIDHVILGEAEVSFRRFVGDLENNAAARVYEEDGKPDLSLTPPPAWELIDFGDYESMLLQFSRGCPFDCEFCDIVRLNGRKPRTKDAGRFVAEVEDLYRRGWRGSVFIVDDNFIGNRPRVKEMLRALASWMHHRGAPFHFFTEASIDLAQDPELMDLMVMAGFNKVFVGIETPVDQSLKEAGKTQNLKTDLLEAVHTIQSRGIEVMGGFIVGFDSDPEDVFERQAEFIQKSGIVMAMVGLLEALKGTRLWARLASEGRLLDEASGDNTDGSLNFIPRMDREKLVRGYRRLVELVYSPAHYYRRCLSFLRTCRFGRVSKIRLNGVAAFLKTIWRIGVKNEGDLRRYYWRLLAWTLLRRPRSFGEAVRLMIVGVHFRKWLDELQAHEAERAGHPRFTLHHGGIPGARQGDGRHSPRA